MSTHGFSQLEWDAAKAEARELMIERARAQGMIPYSDLAAKIKSIRLEAHDQRLFDLLAQISSEEDEAGRGLLSVIVVHKHGDMQPGPGFFELARQRGRKVSDMLRCWVDEVKKVHDHWSRRPARRPARRRRTRAKAGGS